MIRRLYYSIIDSIVSFYENEKNKRISIKYKLKDVVLGKGQLDGNIKIGQYTYINNNFRIVTGTNSEIVIGKSCAIGRNFSCFARTHSFKRPTPLNNTVRHEQHESSIKIGDNVWIGDNVIIKPGLMISDFAIVGANSVVTKNVKKFEIVGGVPARHIRYNTDHENYSE